MGRRKPKPLAVIVSTRITAEEAAWLAKTAKAKDVSLSELVRQKVLGRRL